LFNIFKSNKMENLMHALTAVLKHVQDDPMKPEWIGIQSRGMKQWIAAQMAQSFGICANMRFLFPRQVVEQILTGFNSPDDQQKDQKESLNEDVLFWSAMGLINKSKSWESKSWESRSGNELATVQDYIKDDATGKKLYQLSMKIAKLFDDYQVYRPYMLMEWQRQNNRHDNLQDPEAKWQAWLWNNIISKDSQNHIAYKTIHFLEKFDVKNINTDQLPLRISFFGISSIPAIFLEVFEKISEIMDINLFLLTPSNQFFLDIKSEKQLGQISLNQEIPIDPEQLYYEVANPLLSSLGTAGKIFQSSIESYNYHEPFDDLFSDPLNTSQMGKSQIMLSWLQSDILNLICRKHELENSPVKIEPSDTSVSVHACHSPMREAQVLKDLLINEFEKDPGLEPHDIIVMMPDIEAYAPFIESVFMLEDALPFSISDRKKRSESELLEAFLKILTLRNSRLEQNQVLDLLLSESIAEKFNISFDEISMIEKMVEDAGILWGKDADHRKSFDLPPFEENTWFFGLQRLFMGMAMPENYDALVKDILPCLSFEGKDLKVLGKFAALCNALFSALESIKKEERVEKWCEILKNICFLLIKRNFKNGEDFTFLLQTIDQLQEDALKSGFDGTVSFDVISSIIEQKLDQNISFGKFLTGNITFCNTMPMRSIPFKIVVLMGMDEKSFPRQVFRPGFDLIKRYPEPCDKIERDQERYLFLETLLSARSKFIITYTGISIQDNSMIPCAGVVSELMDTMEQSFVFPEQYSYLFFHPLHPFNQEYFIENGDCFSFSKDNCNIAKALIKDLAKNQSENHMFLQKSGIGKSKESVSSISLSDLIYFFKNPVQWYMKEGLDIKIPDMEDQTINREAFTLSGLDQYNMGSFLVEQNLRLPGEPGKEDYYPILKAMGSLPLGQKGRLEYENISAFASPVIDATKSIASKKQLPAIAVELNINKIMVSENLSGINKDGAYCLSYGKLNGSRLLTAWIRHLFLNLTAPDDYPKDTFVIGRDPAGKKDLLSYMFPSLESDALQYFKNLVQIYTKGEDQLFYFACETSWQLVQVLSKSRFNIDRDTVFKAMSSFKVKNSWYGGYNRKGEKDNRYISLCLENSDPFESVDTLLDSGFVQNSIIVYKPMLDNMKII